MIKKLLAYLMATTIFLGIFPTLGVAANADDDWIEIVSVSPTEYDFSSEITITATINYNLKSVSTGIVYLGFNLSEPDSFDIDLGDKSKQIVSQGEGTVKLSVTILPEEWDISGRADTEFMIYTNLSEYPHPNRWSPLAAFYCPFSDITGYDETGTTDLDILHNSLKKSSEKGDNDLALIAAKMSEKVYTLDSIKGYLTYDLQFDEKNIYDNNFAGMGSLAYVIATKEFDDYSLLVIIARGSTNPHELAQDAFSATDKESYNGYSVYDIIKDFRQAIVEGLENNIDVNKKYKILITGHSLGGAAANYLAARLPSKMKKNHSKDDIYCYTFGAIDSIVSDGTVSDGYENIHNITNFNDSFGPDGWPIFTAKGNTRYGKFGHIDLFYKDIDKGAFGSFENHKMYTYQQAVENNEVYYENHVCQKIVGIHCPVDVVVYANGSVVGKVTNDVIDYSNTSIPICIVGDEKYILLENDMDYDIQMSAFDDGTMSYTIADAQTGRDAKQFDNVKLTKDRELYSSIDNEQDTSQIKLFAESDDGESILEVKEDGSEFVSNEQTAIRKSTGRTNSRSQTSDEIQVILNNSKLNFDQPPIIINDRTLVPLRAIFEALGATVDWDGNIQTVTSKKGNTTVTIAIGDNKLYVNNNVTVLDVPAQIVNDRTLVPVRAISEAFGCNVQWVEASKTVIIKSAVDFTEKDKNYTIKSNLINTEKASEKGNIFTSFVHHIGGNAGKKHGLQGYYAFEEYASNISSIYDMYYYRNFVNQYIYQLSSLGMSFDTEPRFCMLLNNSFIEKSNDDIIRICGELGYGVTYGTSGTPGGSEVIDNKVIIEGIYQDKVLEFVQNIANSAQKGKTTTEKLEIVNDLLCDYFEYKCPTENLEWCIENHLAKCEDYAMLTQYICDLLHIPNYLIASDATETLDDDDDGHAWNYVYVDGEWKMLDVTWNDGSVGNKAYFLVDKIDDPTHQCKIFFNNPYLKEKLQAQIDFCNNYSEEKIRKECIENKNNLELDKEHSYLFDTIQYPNHSYHYDVNAYALVFKDILPEVDSVIHGNPITREDFCNFFAKAIEAITGKDSSEILADLGIDLSNIYFEDTDNPNILLMNAIGIISGVDDWHFDPKGAVNRGAAVTMITRIGEFLGATDTKQRNDMNFFVDTDKNSCNDYVGWIYDNFIFDFDKYNIGENHLNPNSGYVSYYDIYRAANIIYNMFKR